MRPLTLSPLAVPEIERIWIDAAAELGLRVTRTQDAYACSDGKGNIQIGADDLLDDDDAAAQLIFHELCHALVEGERGRSLPDWGLDNSGAGDVTREHACLRVQVCLATPHGLRAAMAPTTEYRAYHDALPGAALGDRDDSVDDDDDADVNGAQAGVRDPATTLARAALARAGTSAWGPVLERALTLTAAWLRGTPERARHPLGFALGPPEETCGGCAWRYLGGRGKAVSRCRQSAGSDGVGRRTTAESAACERWEAPVDCETCGACCREAYHSVTVSMRDPVVWRQPALIVRTAQRFEILRDGDRCAALSCAPAPAPAPAEAEPPSHPSRAPALRGARAFRCTIYQDRPQACRDFEAGGRHCLDARRRVGVSR